jgi:ABC-type Co2+ transport system permease subunit
MILETLQEWMMGLSAEYSVNPYIFATIYIGAIPFFMASIGWIIRNLKREKPLALPILSTGFFLSSAYLYLLVAGENIPYWVYLVVVILLGYGLYTTYQRVNKKRKDGTA